MYIFVIMIIKKQTYNDPDGTLGYVETIFESSNILMTTYFPKTETLFISFNNGHTYSYQNINEEVYSEFEKADSQGKYFNSKIKNNNDYPYMRKYKLFERELKEAKTIVKEWKETNQAKKNL